MSGFLIRNGNRNQENQTSSPEKYPQKYFKEKDCRYCGCIFAPKAPSHHYCSDICRNKAATNAYYKNTYGISLEEVERMLVQQNYKCVICQQEGFKMREGHTSALSLDHCHKTNKIRGLLCHNCNRGLGLFQDNPLYLERAIKYVNDI